MKPKKRSSGFTLVELLITLVILVVLTTIAIPSFADIIRNNRVTGQSNELLALMWLARSEAVKRRVDVTVLISLPASGGWTGVVCPHPLDPPGTTLTVAQTIDACNAALIRRSNYEGGAVEISASTSIGTPPFFFRFDELGRISQAPASPLVLQHENCAAPRTHRRELAFTASGTMSISSEVCQ